MRKLKLATIVGTRPELIKLSEVIKRADCCFEHILIHTGQNYDYSLNEVFFQGLNLRAPDHYLNVAGTHLGESIGNIISRTYAALWEIKPDAVLVLGDTNSGLSVISAKRLKIPIFHMEAGNRCFDENLPEEVNRRMIDHISDVNLPYTEHARRNLLAERIAPEYVFVTGSPMPEVIKVNTGSSTDVLDRIGVKKGQYILLSVHREENVDPDDNFNSLINAINAMAEAYGFPIVYSVHPRSAKIIKSRAVDLHPSVQQLTPFGFNDYITLQQNAYCVASDSGTLAEESGILGFPAVSLRTSTERPEAVDKGALILGGINETSILQAIDLAITLKKEPCPKIPDYQDINISVKIVKIIQGYTGIVNRNIWRK